MSAGYPYPVEKYITDSRQPLRQKNAFSNISNKRNQCPVLRKREKEAENP